MFKNTSFSQRKLSILQVVVLAMALLAPLLVAQPASAAQLTGRDLTISDSDFSATGVDYDFDFSLTTTSSTIQSIKIEACTTAVTCAAAPAGFDWENGSATDPTISQAGWDGGTAFTWDNTGAGGCTPSAAVACLTRGDLTTENDTATREIGIDGVRNGSDAGSDNTEVAFFQITVYDDTGYASTVDTGTVANAWVNDITVNATVEETLTFCVYTGGNCAAGGDTVDLGTLGTGSTVTDSSLSFDVDANANGGISIQYISSGDITSGANTITSAGTGGTVANPGGQEMFGFCVQNVSGGSVTAAAPYSTDCDDAGNDTFAFDESATTFDEIASSGGASNTTTFDAKFGADIQITTESGIYTTNLTFVVVPTY